MAIPFVGVVSGCASLMDDDFQEVSVSLQCREKVIRADCVAENSRGKWFFRAPGVVRVDNSMGPLNLSCRAPYIPQFTVSVMPLPSWGMAGNILAGGLIGASYDVYNNTGLKYPEEITISNPACN